MPPQLYMALVLSVLTCHAYSQKHSIDLPKSSYDPIVIAHRGNHVDVPENTIEAIEEAIRVGADYVEVDLLTSKDGFLVIHHDREINRTTNGTGKLEDFTLNELKSLTLKPVNEGDMRSFRIPELREVLNVCKDRINIYLDFKDADVEQTWKEIKNAGMEHQVIVYINGMTQYNEWRQVAPSLPLIATIPKQFNTLEEMQLFLNTTNIQVIDNADKGNLIAAIKSRGVGVWMDVQHPEERPETWQKALNLGATGLQTDKPEALIDWLKKNGLRKVKL